MARTNAPAPAWFVEKNYGYLGNLDARGWLYELQRWAHLIKEAERRATGEPLFADEWRDILGEDLDRGATPGFLNPPVIEVVDKADQATLRAIEKPALIVKVWLGATDARITEEFEAALRKAREDWPSPVKKPGPRAWNDKFDDVVFTRWRAKQLAPLADLIDWRSCQPEGARASNADFGRWLFAQYGDPSKEVFGAFRALLQAIGCIPALTAQVEFGITKNSA